MSDPSESSSWCQQKWMAFAEDEEEKSGFLTFQPQRINHKSGREVKLKMPPTQSRFASFCSATLAPIDCEKALFHSCLFFFQTLSSFEAARVGETNGSCMAELDLARILQHFLLPSSSIGIDHPLKRLYSFDFIFLPPKLRLTSFSPTPTMLLQNGKPAFIFSQLAKWCSTLDAWRHVLSIQNLEIFERWTSNTEETCSADR